jgi:hypothetical protein
MFGDRAAKHLVPDRPLHRLARGDEIIGNRCHSSPDPVFSVNKISDPTLLSIATTGNPGSSLSQRP